MSNEARNHNLGLRSRYSSLMFDNARYYDHIPCLTSKQYEELGREIIKLYRYYSAQVM